MTDLDRPSFEVYGDLAVIVSYILKGRPDVLMPQEVPSEPPSLFFSLAVISSVHHCRL
jgi:hypothetical protein